MPATAEFVGSSALTNMQSKPLPNVITEACSCIDISKEGVDVARDDI